MGKRFGIGALALAALVAAGPGIAQVAAGPGIAQVSAKPADGTLIRVKYIGGRGPFGVSGPKISGSGFPSFTPNAGGPGSGSQPGQGGNPPGQGGGTENKGQDRTTETPSQTGNPMPFTGAPQDNGTGLNATGPVLGVAVAGSLIVNQALNNSDAPASPGGI